MSGTYIPKLSGTYIGNINIDIGNIPMFNVGA
jgi:hypothetical protein